jgi:hypothetical protein
MIDTVVGLGTVREFCVRFEKSPPRFDGFHNLQKLAIHTLIGIKETMYVLGQMRAVIGKSPNLRYLAVNPIRYEKWSFSPEHQLEIFNMVPEKDNLPLEHLMVRDDWELRLGEALWRNIRNLKTLEITGEEAPYDPPDEFALHWKQFWEGMLENKIWLRKIRVQLVSVALLEYMASYSGIEEFIVDKPLFNKDVLPQTAQIFFGKVFPKHVHSLRVLQIKEFFVTPWCFGKKAVATLRNNRRLEKLSVPIVESKEMTIVSTTALLLVALVISPTNPRRRLNTCDSSPA